MMQYQQQLKLQAFVDGELPEAEARALAEQLTRDPEAAALAAELRQTREALQGFEESIRLPESREFYWSKIAREIQRQEAPAPAPQRRAPLLAWLRQFALPATALALVGLAVLVASHGRSGPLGAETALADSGAFTYHDYSAGATLVWLSYPAETDGAQEDDLGSLE